MTQTVFAESIGISQSLVADWISGKRSITKLHALAIQMVHGVNAEWLLTGQGDMFLPPEPIPGLSEKEMEYVRILRENPAFGRALESADNIKERIAIAQAAFSLSDDEARVFLKMAGVQV